MNAAAAVALIGGLILGAAIVTPAVRRSGLGPWHPAIAWLTLHVVSFGIGSLVLALDGRPGPAIWLAGTMVAFGIGVAASDRLATHRTPAAVSSEPAPPSALRWPAVAVLAGLGVALLLPTLATFGLPFLVDDITGARSQIAGIIVQPLRVAVPALALGLILAANGDGRGRWLGVLAVGGLIGAELLLASRYLAAELVATCVVGMGLAGRSVGARRLVGLALAAVVAFGAIQIGRAYDQAAGREVAFAVERTVSRVIMVQPRTMEAIQLAFPAEEPFLGGLGWLRRLGPAIGRPDIPNLGYWIYPRLFPDQVTAGYAAPGLIGEAWANLGPAGLALFVLLGIISERLGALIARTRRSPANVIAGALAVVFVARTHALGLNGLIILVVLVVLWRIAAGGGLRASGRELAAVARWRT